MFGQVRWLCRRDNPGEASAIDRGAIIWLARGRHERRWAAARGEVRYAFEDYMIDSDRRELTRRAQPIAVGPQIFDLLLHLVRNREHVVSKDELLEAVWSGRIVSE